jgi:hypothetical protein
MPRLKTPEQIIRENEDITNTSLSLMEDLLETNKHILETLTDIAGMIEEALDTDDIEEDIQDD